MKCPSCGQAFRLNEQGCEVLEVLPTKVVTPAVVEHGETAPGHCPDLAPQVINSQGVATVQTAPGTPFQQIFQVAVPER
jgi:hypothetical protein